MTFFGRQNILGTPQSTSVQSTGPGFSVSVKNYQSQQRNSAGKLDLFRQLPPFAENGETTPSEFLLKLQPQPPSYPFVGVFFDVKLFLVDRKDRMKTNVRLPIYIELLYENGELVPNQNILSMLKGSVCGIHGTGQAVISLRLNELSIKHGNRPFRLRFSCGDATAIGAIDPVISEELLVVRHRFKMLSHPPEIWFKDEGGRDKCLEVSAVLLDHEERPVVDRRIRASVCLVYDSIGKDEVKDKSVLKIIAGSVLNVSDTGHIYVKLRIEDVSKNHQKQPFRVRIGADTGYSPADGDVAPACSSPVEVRSKRNKRRGRPASGGAGGRAGSAAVAYYGGSDGFSQPIKIQGVVPSPVGRNTPPAKRMRVNTSTLAPPESSSRQSVASWCRYVHEGLQNIEWHLVSYEMNDDGSHDLSRPIYRCPSCWAYRDDVQGNHSEQCMIFRSLKAFSDSVEMDLSSIESDTPPTQIIMPPPMPEQVGPPPLDGSSRVEIDRNGSSSETDRLLDMKMPMIGTSSNSLAPSLARQVSFLPANSPVLTKQFSGPNAFDQPSLMSGRSMEMPAFQWQVSGNSGGQGGFFDLTSISIPGSQGSPIHEELSVVSILARPATPGYPAFDASHRCVGFYKYDCTGGMSMLRFVKSPVNGLPENGEEMKKIRVEYEKYKDETVKPGERPVLITKEREVKLENMKEQIILRYFEQCNVFPTYAKNHSSSSLL
eukprot:96168_1